MDSLLEVDVANAVDINIMVVDHAEFCVRSKSLDSPGSGGYVVSLEVYRLQRRLVLDIDMSRRRVVGKTGQVILADVDAAPSQVGAGVMLLGWVGVHGGSQASEAKEDGRLHGVDGEEAVRPQTSSGGSRVRIECSIL